MRRGAPIRPGCKSPLRRYWLQVSVQLDAPEEMREAEGTRHHALGYYQHFGVRADSEESARRIVGAAILDGRVRWDDSSARELTADSSDGVMANESDPIWHRGSRVYYEDDA
jgi:hypothetical protein